MPHLSSSPTHTNQSAPHAATSQGAGQAGFHHVDNRPGTAAQLKLRSAMENAATVQLRENDQQAPVACLPSASFQGDGIVQRVTYGGTKSNRNVTVTGANSKSVTFEECLSNSVEYKQGEKLQQGTGTTTPAAWAKWVTNQSNGNNATQLHVVNARWGGLGGHKDGNIVPGTPAENSHHLHQGEKKFDEYFSGGTALEDVKYVCNVQPAYGSAVDVSKGNVNYNDPKMDVNITDSKAKTTNYPIGAGGGLTFKDGG